MNSIGKLLRVDSQKVIIEKVKEIDQKHFPNPWSDSEWMTLNWGHHHLYIFTLEDEILGFALFSIVTGDNVAHLLKICLCPPYRGTEISKGFWISLLNELKQLGMSSVYLEVESTNLRAIKFYKKNNFEQLRVIKGFYSNGGDALTMNLTLLV